MISFCILAGRKERDLSPTLTSIKSIQGLPPYEIILGGNPPHFENVRTLYLAEEALCGRTSLVRNRMGEAAKGNILIFIDDDILFPRDYWLKLEKFSSTNNFDLLLTRFLNPDLTRCWDWCIYDPQNGPSLLPYEVTWDNRVYATSGHFIIKKEVFLDVRFNENLGYNQGEDVEFSARLKAQNYRISFDRNNHVIHNDHSYTQIDDCTYRIIDPLKAVHRDNLSLEGLYPVEANGSYGAMPWVRMQGNAKRIRFTILTQVKLDLILVINEHSQEVTLTQNQQFTIDNTSDKPFMLQLLCKQGYPQYLDGNINNRRIISYHLYDIATEEARPFTFSNEPALYLKGDLFVAPFFHNGASGAISRLIHKNLIPVPIEVTSISKHVRDLFDGDYLPYLSKVSAYGTAHIFLGLFAHFNYTIDEYFALLSHYLKNRQRYSKFVVIIESSLIDKIPDNLIAPYIEIWGLVVNALDIQSLDTNDATVSRMIKLADLLEDTSDLDLASYRYRIIEIKDKTVFKTTAEILTEEDKIFIGEAVLPKIPALSDLESKAEFFDIPITTKLYSHVKKQELGITLKFEPRKSVKRSVLINCQTLSFEVVYNRGIGKYSKNLLKNLFSRYGEKFDFTVLTDRNINKEYWDEFHDVRIFNDSREAFDIYLMMDPMSWLPGYMPFNYSNYSLGSAIFYDLIPMAFPDHFKPVLPKINERLEQLKSRDTLLLAISDATKNDLLKVNYHRVKTILGGVIPKEFADTISYSVPRPYFLVVGAVEPHKNFSLILEALKLSSLAINVVVVGSFSDPYKEYFKLACEKDPLLRNRVIFTGYVDDATLGYLYKHATALLMPSLYEGLGLPVIEAFAQGVPVICSNTTALGEFATRHITQINKELGTNLSGVALTHSPYRAESLKEAMEKLIADHDLQANLRSAGLLSSKHYTWSNTVDLLVEAWEASFSEKYLDRSV